jgi:RNA polymerase sigma factor (sigma-70 family)
LSSADFQARFSQSESAVGAKKWSLSKQAWDKLLNAFSDDQDTAADLYEVARRKLERLFVWRSVEPADEYVDETFNRVARRLDEGQKIDNLSAYLLAVARLICLEAKKEPRTESRDDPENTRQIPAPEPAPTDARLECLDQCLDSLPIESRTLIIDYYQEERRLKIELRQELADRLQIPLNALRIRAHRIRVGLEKCITNCLQVRSETK